MALPFVRFGMMLWRAREAKGMTKSELATFTKIHPLEYSQLERGEVLPKGSDLLQLSKALDIPLSSLKRYLTSFHKRQFKDLPLAGAESFSKQLSEGIDLVKKKYKEKTGKVVSETQQLVFGQLKRDLYRLFIPRLLSFHLLLILDVIYKNSKENLRYLNEIKDFVLKGESLASFIARDFYLGPYLFFAANKLYFRENPSKNIEDCLNRLTVEETKELIYIALSNGGLYDVAEELPILQYHAEFTGLGALMVRELRPHMVGIDADELFMGILIQGIGVSILYTLIQPTTVGQNRSPIDDKADYYEQVDPALFEVMVYELHPIVSAMIAANWDFPKSVIEMVKTHHDHPVKDLNPECAVLKLINDYVSNGFPVMSEEEIYQDIRAYSSFPISAEKLFQAMVKVKNMKKQMLEKTSQIVISQSKDASDYVSNRIKTFATKKTPVFKSDSFQIPKGSDYRFDAPYLQAVLKDCQMYADDLKSMIVSIKPGERFKDYLNRIGSLELKKLYLTRKQDLETLSAEVSLPLEELKEYLGFK